MTDRLEELARRLGTRAAERLDVDVTARKVVARLREQPVRRTPWIHETRLRIAATVVLLVGGALALKQVWPTNDTGAHVAHLVADDLSDLSTDELRTVLASFDEIVGSGNDVPDSTPNLHELDSQQLRAVLRSLEG